MNQETAGRSDNKIKGDNWNFVIMELKQTSDEEVDRGKAAEEAIEQIIRKCMQMLISAELIPMLFWYTEYTSVKRNVLLLAEN